MSGVELITWLRPEAAWLLLPWVSFLVVAYLRLAGRGRSDVAGIEDADRESPWRAVIDPALLPDLRQPAGAVVRTGGADTDHGGPTRSSVRASGTESKDASTNESNSASSSPPDRAPVGAIRPCFRHDWLLALLGLLLIAALAGPQLKRGGDGDRPLRPDAARVLVVDLSPGFSALDEAQQQQVRIDLRSFLRRLPPGETALLVVAGEAWLVVPPTEDVAALDGFIAELSADAVPLLGDQPAAGLALALRTLAATGARQREIYWLRAGDSPPLNPTAIAESGVAAKFLQATAGVDDWLRQMPSAGSAGATGWRNSLLNLAPRPEAGLIDLGPYLILLAVSLAAWRLRRFAALVTWPLLLLGGSVVPLPADAGQPTAAHERGVADYRAGHYDAAAAAFAELLADDARAHYNRGNALARAGRLRAALAAYDESLRLRPDDASAKHNREIVVRLLQPPPNPPPSSPPSSFPLKSSPPAPQSAEAQRAAEQWLRRPPSGNDGLLRRKLAIEESRRSGKVAP